ncbi:MAG: ABC transporter ATP-binding protein [Alphaproteobacteria bacterium]|nr:ABC transporter ATP-binding protein [Alphaproteobacteria bacterium]
MIETDHLSKTFGPITAVDDISFSVEKGEVLGFLGPNGAGKSTTMKMIAGFLPPSAGTARVGGFDVQRDPIAVKRAIGYLPEGAPMWPDMTPHGFLAFIARIRGFHGAEAAQRVEDAVAKTQLATVLHQPIETLSKGFKRRLGLAQALLHDPEVLILDEPTDGLDPNQKHEVRELIRGMSGTKAIIISTHILEEVEALCTRAIIIARGKIVADDTPENLSARSDRHNGVLLASDQAAALRPALEALPDVASVSTEGDNRLFVRPKNHAPIIDQVSKALHDANANVTEITVEHGRLDQVFRDITTA